MDMETCFVWVIKFVSVLYQYLKQCKWQFCMISPQNIVLCLGWYDICLMTLVFHTCLFQLVSRQIWPWGRFVGAFASFKVNVAVSRFCPLSRGADRGIFFWNLEGWRRCRDTSKYLFMLRWAYYHCWTECWIFDRVWYNIYSKYTIYTISYDMTKKAFACTQYVAFANGRVCWILGNI